MITTSLFTIFLTIVVVMVLNTIITTAFIVGGIDYLYDKYKRQDKERGTQNE